MRRLLGRQTLLNLPRRALLKTRRLLLQRRHLPGQRHLRRRPLLPRFRRNRRRQRLC